MFLFYFIEKTLLYTIYTIQEVQYFWWLISESAAHILYRLIIQTVNYFKVLFFEMLMNMAYEK